MRLSDLTRAQIDEWRKARMEKGQEKYGDSHLERYSLVDIAEELLDAQNIIALMQERLLGEIDWSWPGSWSGDVFTELAQVFSGIEMVLRFLQGIDLRLPDSYRDDAKGGERVWWSEQVRRAQDDETC